MGLGDPNGGTPRVHFGEATTYLNAISMPHEGPCKSVISNLTLVDLAGSGHVGGWVFVHPNEVEKIKSMLTCSEMEKVKSMLNSKEIQRMSP